MRLLQNLEKQFISRNNDLTLFAMSYLPSLWHISLHYELPLLTMTYLPVLGIISLHYEFSPFTHNDLSFFAMYYLSLL